MQKLLFLLIMSLLMIFSLTYGDVAFTPESVEKNKIKTASTLSTPLPVVRFTTTMGSFHIEIQVDKVKTTAHNFLSYVQSGFYVGTIFHRVTSNFIIQGGGFTTEMERKDTNPPIPLEINGLSNKRGTIAMARTTSLDSATCEFFINVVDNEKLDTLGGGYAVFGRVIKGMDVIDQIKLAATKISYPHRNIPEKPIVILSTNLLSSTQK